MLFPGGGGNGNGVEPRQQRFGDRLADHLPVPPRPRQVIAVGGAGEKDDFGLVRERGRHVPAEAAADLQVENRHRERRHALDDEVPDQRQGVAYGGDHAHGQATLTDGAGKGPPHGRVIIDEQDTAAHALSLLVACLDVSRDRPGGLRGVVIADVAPMSLA